MKKLFFKLLMIVLLVSPFMALASQDGGGDGNQTNSWQNNDSELPTAYLPLSLNLETCEEISKTELTITYECVSFVFGTFIVVEPVVNKEDDD